MIKFINFNMKKLVDFLTFFLFMPLLSHGQDEITILKEYINNTEYWYERLHIAKDNITHSKCNTLQGCISEIDIKKYVNFCSYMRKDINDKELSKLVNSTKYKKQKNGKDYSFRYRIILKNKNEGKNKDYYFYIYSDMLPTNKQEIIYQIEFFLSSFYSEHGCKKNYKIHQIKKGENIRSIANLYNIDEDMLLGFSTIVSENIVNNSLNLAIDFNNLKIGEVILIPCIPHLR